MINLVQDCGSLFFILLLKQIANLWSRHEGIKPGRSGYDLWMNGTGTCDFSIFLVLKGKKIQYIIGREWQLRELLMYTTLNYLSISRICGNKF